MGERQSSMRSLTAEVTVDDDVITINGAGESSLTFASTYSGAHSFQGVAPDLELDSAAGSSDDPKYLAAVMGNLIGDALAKTKTYLAGVIGKLSVTGTRATTYPAAAIAAEVGDGVSEADGAFIAVLGGDSGQTNARAAYTVDDQNTTPGSGFDYGLDLQGVAHDSYGDVTYLKGAIRLGGDVVLLFGAAGPSDGTTGADVAGPGSLYFRTSTPGVYVNTGSKATPAWKAITHA